MRNFYDGGLAGWSSDVLGKWGEGREIKIRITITIRIAGM